VIALLLWAIMADTLRRAVAYLGTEMAVFPRYPMREGLHHHKPAMRRLDN
jgi:hypothetical protein